MSRSGLYGARHKAKRSRARINARLAERAATLFEQSHRTYEARRLAAGPCAAGARELRPAHRVARLMRGRGLLTWVR